MRQIHRRDAENTEGAQRKAADIKGSKREAVDLELQGEIRRLRGKLKWQGELKALRSDRP
jgi:hypothetical protein